MERGELAASELPETQPIDLSQVIGSGPHSADAGTDESQPLRPEHGVR